MNGFRNWLGRRFLKWGASLAPHLAMNERIAIAMQIACEVLNANGIPAQMVSPYQIGIPISAEGDEPPPTVH